MSIFIDPNCFKILKTLFTVEEMEEMNIKTDYIFADQSVFMKYTNDISRGKKNTSIKLEEKMILFIIEPNKEIVDCIYFANTVVNIPKKTIDFGIIFIPGETPEIIEHLITYQLLNQIELYSFNIEIVPTDTDLYSMDSDDSFKEIYIDKNYNSISQLANIVLKFETAFGKIQHKYIKGDNAKLFNDFLTLKEEEHNIKFNDEIFGMIVLDRSVDFITPLLSNYTYEGMIDEYFGINKGCIKVKRSYVKASFKPEDKKKREDEYIEYPLTSDLNSFYCKLRSMHWFTVSTYLGNIQNKNKKIILESDKKNMKTEEMSAFFSEMNTFVGIKNYFIDCKNILEDVYKQTQTFDNSTFHQKEKSLINGDTQTNSETFYDDCISEKKDLYKILNLLIFESLTQGGIKNYSSLKRDILNIYGYQKIFLFKNLEALGWLQEKVKLKKSEFQQISEKLNLINRSYITGKVDDLSYVEQGYCPLSLKLIERAGEGGWSEIKEALDLIPGETIIPPNEQEIANPTEEVNTIFLVFIGGITYTEIEGIRYLNKKYKEIYENSSDENKTRKQFVIITTQILNSKKLYDSLGKNFGQVYTMKKFYNDVQEQGKKKK